VFAENRGRDKDQHREPCRTGDKGRQEDREQPLFPGLDDPGAEHSRDIAAEAEAHGDETLAVQPDEMHEAVHDEGGPRHVPHVFQKGNDGEEDDEDGKKGQDGPGAPDDAVEKCSPDPRREAAEKGSEPGSERRDEIFETPLQRESDAVGEDKHGREHQEQDRDSEKRPRQHVVDAVRPDALAQLEAGAAARLPLDPVVAAADDGVQARSCV